MGLCFVGGSGVLFGIPNEEPIPGDHRIYFGCLMQEPRLSMGFTGGAEPANSYQDDEHMHMIVGIRNIQTGIIEAPCGLPGP